MPIQDRTQQCTDPDSELGIVPKNSNNGKLNEAFTKFVRLHQGDLLRFAKCVLRCDEKAADCVQETLIKIYQTYPCMLITSPDSTSNLCRLALCILYRCCINEIRRRKPNVPITSINEPFDESGDPSLSAEKNEVIAIVREEINKLNEHYRGIVHAHYGNDLSYEELAELHCMSPGAIRQLLFRVRNILKTKIKFRIPELYRSDSESTDTIKSNSPHVAKKLNVIHQTPEPPESKS